MQLSVTARNGALDGLETAIGPNAVLKLRTGSAPANCAAADTGAVLATLGLPADWMAAASGGSKVLTGTWSDSSADASGDAGYFRIYASDGTTCHLQGTVSATGGSGELQLSSITIAASQTVTITAFSIAAANT